MVPQSPPDTPTDHDPAKSGPAKSGPAKSGARPARNLLPFGQPLQTGVPGLGSKMAIGLTLLWLAVVVLVLVAVPDATQAGLMPTGGVLSWAVFAIGVALPVALIWVIDSTARSIRDLRDEAARLKITIDSLRQNQHARTRLYGQGASGPGASAQGASGRASGASAKTDRKPAAPDAEPGLALEAGLPEDAPPVDLATAIRALNFPENTEDRAGFRALQAALQNRALAKLIRAAQDVLTLLSQDGIYMDDLAPVTAPPEVWRRFAIGIRGPEIAGMAAIEDADILGAVATRMRADTIFRDAAHHFLRQFDRSFADFEAVATDEQIAALCETRTARAFMLIGRVTKVFD